MYIPIEIGDEVYVFSEYEISTLYKTVVHKIVVE